MTFDKATLLRAHERFLEKQRSLNWSGLIVLLRKLDEDDLEALVGYYRRGDEKRMGGILQDHIDLTLWEAALLEIRAEARQTQEGV